MRVPVSGRRGIVLLLAAASLLTGACTPAQYRRQANEAAERIILAKQIEAFGETRPFSIERPADTLRRQLLIAQHLPYAGPPSLGANCLPEIPHWPEPGYPECGLPPEPPPQPAGPMHITLVEALEIAAANNMDYQSQKEDVFLAALDLNLARDQFDNTFLGLIDSTYSADLGGDETVTGIDTSGTLGWSRRLKSGAVISSRLVLDLVQLLRPDRQFSRGLAADVSMTLPLLRGAGRYVVTEPLTQAERNVVYAMYSLERSKRTLAVRVASNYLSVLQQLDQIDNAAENYRSLILSERRARGLAGEGRLPEIQVDQARQDVLRARDRWISAQQNYARQLDAFKVTLGLPADADIELDRRELVRLAQAAQERIGGPEPDAAAEEASAAAGDGATAAETPVELEIPTRAGGGPLEMDPIEAVAVALEHRLDLLTAEGRVFDAQRRVAVAANALQAGLDLAVAGSAGQGRSLGSAGAPNAQLRPELGFYSAGLSIDLPLERTQERNAYRESYIALERAVRSMQQLEDQVKLDVRNALRTLLANRESYRIQALAVELASRRVESTQLFLQLGRAEIRDVLEAQEALVSAQNALTAALVSYRVAELELQRDMGVLNVDEQGLWSEYEPENP